MHLSVGDLRSGVGSPGALVMNRSELPMWVLETNLGHLGKKKKKAYSNHHLSILSGHPPLLFLCKQALSCY